MLLESEYLSLSGVLRINIHSHTVYYTSKIKKKFCMGKIFLAVFGEWPEMWESCLLLMLFFSPTFEFFEATFPPSSAEIATHLGSSCLCPDRTSLLFYLIRFRGPAMVGSLGFFKEVIFLISQASEELKITGWKSERQSCSMCQHYKQIGSINRSL